MLIELLRYIKNDPWFCFWVWLFFCIGVTGILHIEIKRKG